MFSVCFCFPQISSLSITNNVLHPIRAYWANILMFLTFTNHYNYAQMVLNTVCGTLFRPSRQQQCIHSIKYVNYCYYFPWCSTKIWASSFTYAASTGSSSLFNTLSHSYKCAIAVYHSKSQPSKIFLEMLPRSVATQK